MKKIIKILLTILFCIGAGFAIRALIIEYGDGKLAFVVLAFTMFFIHLFAWIAPKTFFNLCWKITKYLPDNYDYETSYSKLEKVDIGIVIVANICMGISFAF